MSDAAVPLWPGQRILYAASDGPVPDPLPPHNAVLASADDDILILHRGGAPNRLVLPPLSLRSAHGWFLSLRATNRRLAPGVVGYLPAHHGARPAGRADPAGGNPNRARAIVVHGNGVVAVFDARTEFAVHYPWRATPSGQRLVRFADPPVVQATGIASALSGARSDDGSQAALLDHRDDILDLAGHSLGEEQRQALSEVFAESRHLAGGEAREAVTIPLPPSEAMASVPRPVIFGDDDEAYVDPYLILGRR